MAKKWVVAAKKADFNDIANRYGISPYLARIIRNRDIITDEEIDRYLNGTLDMMHSPTLLKDMELAGEILWEAIEAGVKIRIVGDYDVDGVCASLILQKGLEFIGAIIDVELPDRVNDGYGINERIITEAAADGVELIITCDNGIAAVNEIELAMSLGLSVIITDHHEVPYSEELGQKRYILPKADAVINPKQENCSYPFSGICGAMVAYKLVQYMIGHYGGDYLDQGIMTRKNLLEELLSFASIATVCDVMELTDENRIAVKYGVECMKHTSNIGMKALINVTGINVESLSVYHFGFVLGPCINSSGRLDTAKRALELFLCEDEVKAQNIAKELYDLNTSRKNMTLQFTKQAIEIVNERYADDKVIVLFLQSCHESIAGLIAGKVREHFYKPTIVLTLDGEGNVKGSGRSIEAYNMFEELSNIKELFTKYGGHKMAAGMSMIYGNVEEVRERLNNNCTLTEDELIEKCVIDIALPIGYATMELVDEIEKLAPFGVANSKPLFAQKEVPIKSVQLMGKDKNVLKLVLDGVNAQGKHVNVNAIYYGDTQKAYEEISEATNVSILYQAGINEYNGKRSVQLTIKDYMI